MSIGDRVVILPPNSHAGAKGRVTEIKSYPGGVMVKYKVTLYSDDCVSYSVMCFEYEIKKVEKQ